MAYLIIYQKGRDIVYTSSWDICKELEQDGFKRILEINGTVEKSGESYVIRGKDYMDDKNNKAKAVLEPDENSLDKTQL